MRRKRARRSPVMSAMVLVAIILLAFMLASAGCGGSKAIEGTESAGEEKGADAAREEEAGKEGQEPGPEDGDFSFQQVTGGTEEVMVLKDIRFGDHPAYERVVIEFTAQEGYPRTGTPRFRARWVEPPYSDAEGKRVEIAGDHLIELYFSGNAADLTVPEGHKVVYQGPESFTPGFSVIREAKLVPAYELNSMILLVGLGERAPFRVQELSSPPRIVIDVRK